MYVHGRLRLNLRAHAKKKSENVSNLFVESNERSDASKTNVVNPQPLHLIVANISDGNGTVCDIFANCRSDASNLEYVTGSSSHVLTHRIRQQYFA